MAYPATFDIPYYRGDTYKMILYPKTAAGTPFDLAGYTAEFAIGNKRGKDPTRTTFLGGVEIIDSSMMCTIPAETGDELAGATWYYDVQISKGTDVFTIVTGTITVRDGVEPV